MPYLSAPPTLALVSFTLALAFASFKSATPTPLRIPSSVGLKLVVAFSLISLSTLSFALVVFPFPFSRWALG